jgi:YggT family protein
MYSLSNTASFIVDPIVSFLSIYSVLLIIRILLTWFPTVNWSAAPFNWLSQITDPYLNLFRSIIPPLGGMDLSPMLAILLLQMVLIPGLSMLA